MANRKTYRGKLIDMDALQRQNEQSTAMGNMGVNAKGDKLGKGGKVVEPANSRSRTHYNTKRTTVNNRGSLKSEPTKDERKVFDEQKDEKAKTTANQKKGPSTQKKPSKQQAATEVELDNGDIVVEENKESDDSENS
tara:strand:- start:790 stop:1200 length:411 start_codon:yes stop_codon:yes gene_type:complete